MAIVPNKDGQGIKANGYASDVDPKYATPNRSGSGVPTGPSLYAGEIMLDTATGLTYMALSGPGTTQWVNTDVG
jgi:hypothetical protein